MLGRHIRLTQSCNFAIHKLFLNFCGKERCLIVVIKKMNYEKWTHPL